MTSRRVPFRAARFLKKSALAAGALALPLAPFRARAAGPLKPVNFTLDWIYEGPNLGFLVAHDQGFYRDAGLDVSITAGKGSGNTAQLVANKATQIGFADGYAVSNGDRQGHGHQDHRQHLPPQSVRHHGARRFPHQDAEGSRRQNAGDDRGQRPIPAMARLRQGRRPRRFQDPHRQPRRRRASARRSSAARSTPSAATCRAMRRPSSCAARKQVRIFWYSDYGVNVGLEWHHHARGSDQERSRSSARVRAGELKGFLYGAAASRTKPPRP